MTLSLVLCTIIHGKSCLVWSCSIVLHGILQSFRVIYGLIWFACMVLYGHAWLCSYLLLYSFAWSCILFAYILESCMVLCGFKWFHMVLYGLLFHSVWSCMILYALLRSCMGFQGPPWYLWYCMYLCASCMVLYGSIWSFKVLFYNLWSYMVF